MNSEHKYKSLVLLVLIFLLPSCLRQSKVEFPNVGMEQDRLNQELEITLLSSNTYIIDDPINLIVGLHSNNEVYTDNNFGARMYILNARLDKWEEVYDPVKSYSKELDWDLKDFFPGGFEEIVLSEKDNTKLDQLAIKLFPEIKSDNNSVKLLVILIGHIYENDTITDQKIGAYTILTLRQ